MRDEQVKQNTTSRIVNIKLRSATTGLLLTGKVASDFSGTRHIAGGTTTALSFAAGTAGDAFSSGKICPLTNGTYDWHTPDAMYTALGQSNAVISCAGAIDVGFDFQVVAPDRAIAAFGANTTTPATPTNVSDVQTAVLAKLPAALTANGNMKSSLLEIITTALSEGATGRIAAAWQGFWNIVSPVATAATVNQTGDSFARIGAAGAGLTAIGDTRLANLDVAISVIQSQITALNNLSAKANWFGYPLLEVPDSGTRAYVFELVIKDDEDKLVNLDALPTIALVNAAGTDRSALITTGVANPSTGRYTITITVGTATVNESLKLTATGTIGAETRYASYGTQVVDYDTATLVNEILTTLGTAGAGLTNLGDARIGTINTNASTAATQSTAGAASAAAAAAAIAGVQSDTNDIQTRLPAALDGGRIPAALDTESLLAALGLDAGNLDEQLADILAASGGGGGGGALTAEQNALLVSIAQWAARNNGGPMHYTGNVGDGGVLELTVGDDHETVMENDLPIVVKDPGGLFRAKLVASGSTLSWSAGQDGVGGLITGTVATPAYDSGTELTTIVVQVPNCAAAGNITTPYKWQLKRTSGGKIKTELQGTLRLNADMS